MVKINVKCLIFFIFVMLSTYAFPMAGNPINWDEAVDRAIKRYGIRTEPELIRFFRRAGVQYPPKEIALLAFKQEQHIELWAKNKKKVWRHIHTYPLTASSGHLGPKLKERDLQIPEGIYQLTSFNPYSKMHLSMQINYPNAFDKKKALSDGRTQLGNNIFLHGKSYSVGCLAVGDHAIDQLFMLSRRVGLKRIKLIIAPNDLRYGKAATPTTNQPRWLPELYHQIEGALEAFPTREKA